MDGHAPNNHTLGTAARGVILCYIMSARKEVCARRGRVGAGIHAGQTSSTAVVPEESARPKRQQQFKLVPRIRLGGRWVNLLPGTDKAVAQRTNALTYEDDRTFVIGFWVASREFESHHLPIVSTCYAFLKN